MTDTGKPVPLGRSGLEVSRIALGCMGLSDEGTDEGGFSALLHRAADLGATLFNTAGRQGRGHSERLIGRFVAASGVDLVLAAKFGLPYNIGKPQRVDGGPGYVQLACDARLQHLGVETIDLYYLDRPDPAVPIEETVAAMGALVTAGKMRALGLSAVEPKSIRRAHAVHEIAAVQNEYSRWSRDVEGSVLDTCRELGITFVARSPLSVGLRAGARPPPSGSTGRDQRARQRRLGPHNIERYLDVLGRRLGNCSRRARSRRSPGCTHRIGRCGSCRRSSLTRHYVAMNSSDAGFAHRPGMVPGEAGEPLSYGERRRS